MTGMGFSDTQGWCHLCHYIIKSPLRGACGTAVPRLGAADPTDIEQGGFAPIAVKAAFSVGKAHAECSLDRSPPFSPKGKGAGTKCLPPEDQKPPLV